MYEKCFNAQKSALQNEDVISSSLVIVVRTVDKRWTYLPSSSVVTLKQLLLLPSPILVNPASFTQYSVNFARLVRLICN